MSVIAKSRRNKETLFYSKNYTTKTKAKIRAALFIPVKILNIKTGKEKIIMGNKQAAKYLKMGMSTLYRYKKQGKV